MKKKIITRLQKHKINRYLGTLYLGIFIVAPKLFSVSDKK